MRIAIYTRISTDKQSHDSQLTELREYCYRRGWKELTEFSDVISGAKFTRTGLEKLMAEVRRGRINTIVCFKLDRLGRSLPHLAQICSELGTHGVALICTSQGIDTSNDNPAGRLQLGVLMAVAEFERSIIQERVAAGLKAAKLRGVKLGRPDRVSRLLPQVRVLLEQGNSVRFVAAELHIAIGSAQKLCRLARNG